MHRIGSHESGGFDGTYSAGVAADIDLGLLQINSDAGAGTCSLGLYGASATHWGVSFGANGLLYLNHNEGTSGMLFMRRGSTFMSFNNLNFWPNQASMTLGKAANPWGNVYADSFNLTSKQTYSVSNVTTDRTYDADATTIAEVADVLGTLIADLRTIGLLT